MSRNKSILPSPDQTRLVTITAHVDHGKTTLADSLCEHNGIISERLAGTVRYLDSMEEEQRRGITIRSSAIALKHVYRPVKKMNVKNSGNGGGNGGGNAGAETNANNNYVVHLIDSPGHVDFSAEVSSALQICDGTLLVVDVVEGMCARTHSILREAYSQKLVPVLVLNKIDRLCADLGLSLNQAYVRLRSIIENVNAAASAIIRNARAQAMDVEYDKNKAKAAMSMSMSIQTEGDNCIDKEEEQQHQLQMKQSQEEEEETLELEEELWTFDPSKGNVVFTTALYGWGFTIPSLARSLFKSKIISNIKPPIMRQYLFHDVRYDVASGKIFKWKIGDIDDDDKVTMFGEYALRPLWDIMMGVSTAATCVGIESVIFSSAGGNGHGQHDYDFGSGSGSGSGSGATNTATMGLSKSQKKRLKRNKKKNTSAAAAALESGPGTTSTADMSTNIYICGDANDGSKEAKSSAHLPQDQKVESKVDAFLDEILRNNNNNSNEQQQQQNKSSAKNVNTPQHPNPYAIPKGRSMTSLLQYIHERYIHSVAEEQSQTSSGGGSIISGGGSRKQQGKKISQTSNSSSLSSSLGSSFQSSSLGNSLNSNSSIKSKASASANNPCNFMPSIALQEIYNVITSIQCRQCQYACTTFMNQISYNTSFRYSGGSDKWGSNKSLGGSNMPNLEVDCGAGGGSEAFIKKSARYHMIRLDQDSAAKTPGEDMKRSNSGRSLGSGSNLAIPVSGGCNFDGNNEDLDIENAMRYELMEEGDSCLAATSTADDDSISKKQLNGLQLDIVMDVISGQKQIELDVTNAPTCFNADASQPNEASQSLVFSMENFECLVRDVILPCGLPAFRSPAPREMISEEDINTLQKDSKAFFHEIVDKISLLNSTISKAKVLLDDAEESSRASTPFNPKAMKYLKNCSDSQLQYIRIFRELLLKLNQRTFMLRTIKHDYQKWATKLINKLWDAYETCIQSLIEPSLRHIWKVMQLDSNRTGSVPLLFNNPTQREYLRQLLLNKSNVLLRLHDQMEGILFPNSIPIDLENTTSKPFPIFSRLVTLGVYFDTVNKVKDGVGGNYVAILDKRNEVIFETILQTDITKIKELQSNRCRSLMEIAEEQLQSVEEDLNKTTLNKKDDLTWTAHKIMTEECLVVNLDLEPSLDHDLQKLRHLCELVKNVLNQGRFRDEIVALSSISKSNEHVKTPAAIVDLSENLHTDRVIKANENNCQLKCEGGGGRRRIAGILSVCLYNWLQKKCLEWHADLTQNELLQSLFQEDESIKPLPSKRKKKRKKKTALQTSNGGDGNGETVNSLKDTTRTAEKSDANPITMEAKPEIVEEKIELKDETDATAISEAEIEKEKIDLVEPKGEHDVSDKADAVDSNPRQMQSSLIPQDEFLPSADDSDILERDEISESRYIPQVGISDGGTTISAEEFLCNRLDEALKANDVHFI